MKSFFLAFSLTCTLPVFAEQTAPNAVTPNSVTPNAVTPRKTLKILRLKNLAPSVVAFWLDAKNNPAPEVFFQSALPFPSSRVTTFSPPSILPPEPRLLVGIERIFAVDPQNILLVAGGSDEDFAALKTTVDALDEGAGPFERIEWEAKTIALSRVDFPKYLGQNFDAQKPFAGEISPSQLAVWMNQSARLSAPQLSLEADGGIKIGIWGPSYFLFPDDSTEKKTDENWCATPSFLSTKMPDKFRWNGKIHPTLNADQKRVWEVFIAGQKAPIATLESGKTWALELPVPKAEAAKIGADEVAILVLTAREVKNPTKK